MTIVLEVIICTCNRASELDRMLAALASQSQAKDIVWSVLVVDNGSQMLPPGWWSPGVLAAAFLAFEVCLKPSEG